MTDRLISLQEAVDAIVNTPSKVGYHDNSEVARYGATFRQHEIIDIIERLPPAQPDTSRIEKMLHGLSPEEQYDFLRWIMCTYAMQYTDSREAVIAWLGGAEGDER